MNILSGCNKLRFHSRINHEVYCQLHNYRYVNDGKKRELKNKFDHKIGAILDIPIDNKWWFWLDDDAFFTNFETKFSDLSLPLENNLLLFAHSPVNENNKWAYICSGNFFFKKTEEIHYFFNKVLNQNLLEVKEWWNEEKYGMFTNGDQDKILFHCVNDDSILSKTKIISYHKFNTRTYHFNKLTDNFLVHFTKVNQMSKYDSIKEFQKKFNLTNETLIPPQYKEFEISNIENKIKELQVNYKNKAYKQKLEEFLKNLKEK